MSTTTRIEQVARRVSTRTHRALSVLPLTTFVVDLAIIALAVIAAATLRATDLIFAASPVQDFALVACVIGAGWISLIAIRGGYDSEVFGAGMDEYRRVLSATALAAGLVGIGCYLAQFPLSRGFFVMTFAIGMPALLVSRLVLRKALQRARRRGHLRQRVLIVGTPSSVDEIAKVLRRETWLGFEVMGALTPATDGDSETSSGIPVLGNADEAGTLPKEVNADLVFFAGGGVTSAAQMRRIQWSLEHENIHVVVAPHMTDVSGERLRIRPVGGLPLIYVGKPRASRAHSLGKRAFDVVGAAAALLASSPVLLLAAWRIKRHDRGPVFFRQERIGRNGLPFLCLKLRTMAVDAESDLAALHVSQGPTDGLFKMQADPRVTAPGRLLRRYSLDELPQLWNVLRGEMSLVGPRPPLPAEVADYDHAASRRLQVRPGMTGLWQVSGRSTLSWQETVRLDIYYVDNFSMLQDLSILMKTVRAVLRPEGAY